MIDISGAIVSFSNYTVNVGLEETVGSVDRDADRTNFDGCLDAFGVLFDFHVAGNIGYAFFLLVFTSLTGLSGVARDVGIIRLFHRLVILEPIPGPVVHATLAAVVSSEAL